MVAKQCLSTKPVALRTDRAFAPVLYQNGTQNAYFKGCSETSVSEQLPLKNDLQGAVRKGEKNLFGL
jgi:hypothetical protein